MSEEKKKTRVEEHYQRLRARLQGVSWILNGSVMANEPCSDSPRAKTTYTWTRKIQGKTVTVALSKSQYDAFRKAIETNRKLEQTLREMRELSAKTLLNALPGVQRKPRKNRS
jgi:hypothetical protein